MVRLLSQVGGVRVAAVAECHVRRDESPAARDAPPMTLSQARMRFGEDESNTLAATGVVLTRPFLQGLALPAVKALCRNAGLPTNANKTVLIRALCRPSRRSMRLVAIDAQLTGQRKPPRLLSDVEAALEVAGFNPRRTSPCLRTALLDASAPFRAGHLETGFVLCSAPCAKCGVREITSTVHDVAQDALRGSRCGDCGALNYVRGLCVGRPHFALLAATDAHSCGSNSCCSLRAQPPLPRALDLAGELRGRTARLGDVPTARGSVPLAATSVEELPFVSTCYTAPRAGDDEEAPQLYAVEPDEAPTPVAPWHRAEALAATAAASPHTSTPQDEGGDRSPPFSRRMSAPRRFGDARVGKARTGALRAPRTGASIEHAVAVSRSVMRSAAVAVQRPCSSALDLSPKAESPPPSRASVPTSPPAKRRRLASEQTLMGSVHHTPGTQRARTVSAWDRLCTLPALHLEL
ncbi:hypothetical protein KFE25_001770 [Diacronema lutheri]|uniref:Uncharacterized protein n=1 Tax=Diacronema lutheri TaxID=2081491 RepID=A0A8J6C5W3_DIALT|nr:hypothetical protein KFE25_001770 [Diacronema lutheri]